MTNKSISLIVILLCALNLMCVAQEKTSEKRAITIDDDFLIKSVGAPKLSPNEMWIAYTVTTTVLEKDKSYYQIWMTPIIGGEAVPLTSKTQDSWDPVWSKDGKWLYFLSERNDDYTQLWKLNMVHGGEAIQVSKMKKRGIGSFKFSSDEKKLLLTLKDRDPEKIREENDTSYVKPTSPLPYVIDRQQFKQDYVGYLNHQRNHVHIYDIPSQKLTQITFGDYDDASPDWSPDDKWVTFNSNRTENPDGNYNEDIWVVSANNTALSDTLQQISKTPGEDTEPKWSPDGKWIAYLSVKEEYFLYGLYRLTIVHVEGGAPKIISEIHDRNISSFRWAKDSKSIYGIFEDHGMESLVKFKVIDSSMEEIIEGKRVVSSYDIGTKGKIVAKVSSPTVPYEIYIKESGNLRKLTSLNDSLMSKLKLSDIETISFKSVDDWDIEGFIYKPIGYEEGKRYPTILRIHGGPMSQYSYGFAFDAQLFAANGYVVVKVNPRGSTGYGEKFGLGIMADWGNKDYQDVMKGVNYAIEKGYADSTRLGVGGWSYGGILTNYVITQTTRFKAATTGASATLVIANYGHDMYQRWYEYELELPWEDNNRELYEKLSSLNKVANIKTPTLILCGENDWNVPVLNSELLYQSLKRIGIDTELIVYPGQGHSGFPPSYDKDVYQRYLGWFEKYLKY
ncbi:MAG: S9 family peptidase [Flavobacteriales bacterium]|nr:S9 family peptidase [Flavobacteriales bacterium]